MKQIKPFLCTLLAMLMLPTTGAFAQTVETITSTFISMEGPYDMEVGPHWYGYLNSAEGNKWMFRCEKYVENKTVNGSFALTNNYGEQISIISFFNIKGYVKKITVRAGGKVGKINVRAGQADIGTVTTTTSDVQDYDFWVGDDIAESAYVEWDENGESKGNVFVDLIPNTDGDATMIIESIKIQIAQKEEPFDGHTGYCGPYLQWFISNDNPQVLTIRGTGRMFEYFMAEGTDMPQSTAPWAEYGDKITKLVIEEGATSVGDFAFYYFMNLTTVVLPSTGLQRIGSCAFYECPVKEINLPEGIEEIGDMAFRSNKIETLTVPNSLKKLNSSAFSRCPLKSIAVASDNSMFDSRGNCNAIIRTATNELILGCETTVIPEGVASIGFDAFNYCKGLTSITIPTTVETIDNNAFYACSGLTTLVVPDKVSTIGSSAFNYCSGMETLTIGSGLTSIGKNAFDNMNKLADVICTADPEKLTWEGNDNASCCKKDGTTQFHVTNPAAWKAKFPDAHVQFVAISSVETVEGDVSGDGKTDAEDVVALMKYIAGMAAGISVTAADVNKDGKVDVADVVALVNLIIK